MDPGTASSGTAWIHLTRTAHDDGLAIRLQAGRFDARESDVETAFDTIVELARSIDPSGSTAGERP